MAGEIPKTLKESLENSKAEYVQLGKSGLRVSVPIFGAMSIGHPDWAPWVMDEEKVFLPIISRFITSSEEFFARKNC